uniref:Neur_chan_LBD domain-containing protein n=1 Tax=Steinernema glaseri TaxID=37863 RepID=A0A1I8ADS6_9BILA
MRKCGQGWTHHDTAASMADRVESYSLLEMNPLCLSLSVFLLLPLHGSTGYVSEHLGRLLISDVQNDPKDNEIRRLFDYLFQDYVKEIRPVRNDSHPLTVSVQFWLKQILKVDERNQIVNIYLWLEMYWRDEYLRWDPDDFDGLDTIHIPSTFLWKPDICVYNKWRFKGEKSILRRRFSANMNIDENELETNVIVDHTGLVTLFRSMITDITCTLNLREFPFDQQVCHLTLASWTFDGSKIQLEPMNRTDNLDYYIKNSEWTLTDYTFKMYERVYDCCPYAYPDITYFFVIRRSPSYYIFSLVIPSAFITVVTVIGFFTPHSSTGENTEKVSLGVTALLSMAIIMMMVSDEVPATSEIIPLIGKYYIGLIFIIFLAAYTTTLTLAFQMRGNSGVRLNPRLKYFLFEKVARNPWLAWFVAAQLSEQKNIVSQRNGKTEMTYVFDVDSVEHNVYRRGGVADAGFIVNRGAFVKRTRTLGERRVGSGRPTECSNQDCVLHIVNRIKERLDTIESFIFYQHYLKQISNEWEQATRIMDRFIMVFYILGTVTFAMVMLLGGPSDLILTEELMDKAVNS